MPPNTLADLEPIGYIRSQTSGKLIPIYEEADVIDVDLHSRSDSARLYHASSLSAAPASLDLLDNDTESTEKSPDSPNQASDEQPIVEDQWGAVTRQFVEELFAANNGEPISAPDVAASLNERFTNYAFKVKEVFAQLRDWSLPIRQRRNNRRQVAAAPRRSGESENSESESTAEATTDTSNSRLPDSANGARSSRTMTWDDDVISFLMQFFEKRTSKRPVSAPRIRSMLEANFPFTRATARFMRNWLASSAILLF